MLIARNEKTIMQKPQPNLPPSLRPIQSYASGSKSPQSNVDFPPPGFPIPPFVFPFAFEFQLEELLGLIVGRKIG